MSSLTCRFCGKPLVHVFADLGMSPLSNAYVSAENLYKKESFYPLKAFVCSDCFLVQVLDVETPEDIFCDYAYFSSYSESWLKHSQAYVQMAVSRFGLKSDSRVVEIASNDGYLLQYFKDMGIPVLGIEPAENVARAAQNKGIDTIVEFFGVKLADKLVKQEETADLIVGNNVLAHVPDINDFVAGVKRLLKYDGVITMEFPHLLELMKGNQFDTIYHEHFSYFSFSTVSNIFSAHGLKIFDVEQIPTHGGSLRIYACHDENPSMMKTMGVTRLLALENAVGMAELETYTAFYEQVKGTKQRILEFLIKTKRENKRVAAYGAPAKGNTLLNYCEIGIDFIDFTVDRNPYKQGRYLPGTHIPIEAPDKILEAKPDYLIILPWNLTDEIVKQEVCIREWGGKFVVLIPEVEVF